MHMHGAGIRKAHDGRQGGKQLSQTNPFKHSISISSGLEDPAVASGRESLG